VVIPNVVGLLGRGGKQAYQTDEQTIQLAGATFFADVHAGFRDASSDDDVTSPYDPTTYDDNVWGDNAGNDTIAGHYYPTSIGVVSRHYLTLSTNVTDPDQPSNPRVDAKGVAAVQAVISASAIWMGLLVTDAGDGTANDADGDTNRWTVSPLANENGLYLNEYPKSASFAYNGDPQSGKTGGYTWVVAQNGKIFGCYTPDNGTTWYQGYAGAYP
jgi:hypothetical protein